MDEFEDILAAAQQQRRDDAQGSLTRIMALREQKQAIEQELNMLETRLRGVLEDNPEPVIDGERGIVATLRERKKPASIDLATLAKQPRGEEYLGEAARAGVLSVAMTPLRALRNVGWADAILAKEIEGGVSMTLSIEAAK